MENLLGLDDEYFILKDEQKADENESIIVEHIRLLSQDNELLGDTLMRMTLHIDVVKNHALEMASMEAERMVQDSSDGLKTDLYEAKQQFRQSMDEIAKNFSDYAAGEVKEDLVDRMETAFEHFERKTNGAFTRYDKVIDSIYEWRHRNEKKGKDAS